MVDCWLPYGETEIYVAVEMEQLLGIAEPKIIEPEKTAQQIIDESLLDSSGRKRLSSFTGPGCRVAIVIEGSTPPGIATIVLSTLVRQLVELIIPKQRIKIIIGNGAYSKSNHKLLEAIMSHNDLSGIRIIEHAKDKQDLVEVGVTTQGTPVKVNRSYRDASLKIAIGVTRTNPYTGFTGAYSAVLPGISGNDTILANRKHIFKDQSRSGKIELNPIKEDAIEVIKLSGIDFAINLNLNYNGNLIGAHTGNFEESWGKSITGLEGSYEVKVQPGADIMLLSAGGTEFDRYLYSAIWALNTVESLVKKNGAIILLAECSDGLGAETFTTLARVEQLSEFERRFSLGAEALQMLKRILRNNRVILVSALPGYLVEPLGVEVARTANEAYERVVRSRRGRKTLVVPYGCSTILTES